MKAKQSDIFSYVFRPFFLNPPLSYSQITYAPYYAKPRIQETVLEVTFVHVTFFNYFFPDQNDVSDNFDFVHHIFPGKRNDPHSVKLINVIRFVMGRISFPKHILFGISRIKMIAAALIK